MSYTITLTDGAIFATVADGTINTASSMTLVGKNYAGYGQFLDTNFIRLLENGSNTTAPGSPLEGQLWWDSGASLLKVYNGTTFKTISAATASSGAPTSNVTGDLWYDTVNQQLKVYTGTSFLLIGPQFSAGEGTSGAIVATIVDNTSVSHIVVQLFVNDSIVGMISKDATFTPQSAISGFSTIRPGITLSTLIGAQVPLFQGTATNSQLLNSLTSSQFMRSDANTTTTGAMTIFSNNGLGIGENSDLRIGVNAGDVFYRNQTVGGNLYFGVNVAGNTSPTLIMFGSNGAISGNQINANYADVAERFEADTELPPGTVVELGGSAEITQVSTDLSEKVFGVISTRAAYLMNSQAGSDATHPPVAMTGRVPVKAVGLISKGNRLVSAGRGMVRAAQPGEATAFNVIGRALADKLDLGDGMIEAIVTVK